MNRYRIPLVWLFCAVMTLASAMDATATTKHKKKPADDDDDSSTPKPKATPALDLPLPSKSKASPTPTPPKKGDNGDDSATPKPGEPKPKPEHAPDATVEPEAIKEFAAQPARIQQLIRDAMDLTKLNLTYTFGSSDPNAGGMDCSGTIYYLLRGHEFPDVPRDSAGQYMWARHGGFFPVLSKSADSPEFKDLQPGDLMFWTGTYETGRDIPISHVMLYLGREKSSGKRIMFGASDGRSYNGIQRWGVSVFDFKMPKSDPTAPVEKSKAEFVGYARIPGLRSPAAPLLAEEDKSTPDKPEKSNKPDTTDKPDKDDKSEQPDQSQKTGKSSKKHSEASSPSPTPKKSTPRHKKKPASDD